MNNGKQRLKTETVVVHFYCFIFYRQKQKISINRNGSSEGLVQYKILVKNYKQHVSSQHTEQNRCM